MKQYVVKITPNLERKLNKYISYLKNNFSHPVSSGKRKIREPIPAPNFSCPLSFEPA